MITLSIAITGADALTDRLRRAPDIADDALRAELEPFAGDLADLLADYPPEPTNSTYQRTGRLGRGWKVAGQQAKADGSGGNLEIRLFNGAVDYDTWVQHAPDQAAVHQGRWMTDREIADLGRDSLPGVGQRVARRIRDGITGG